jgi:hypothetical protein
MSRGAQPGNLGADGPVQNQHFAVSQSLFELCVSSHDLLLTFRWWAVKSRRIDARA